MKQMKALRLALAGTFAAGLSAGAVAANFVLPTPVNSPGIVIESTYLDATGAARPALLFDGIPIAFKYDDFWSYSGHILTSIQTQNPTLFPTGTFGTYDFSTGTGNILLNLSSVAGGASNPTGIQEPLDLPGGGTTITGWEGEWGGDPQTLEWWRTVGQSPQNYSKPASGLAGSTTTVGELLSLLQGINPLWTVPVLYADYNQTGGGDSLFMSAQVRVLDATGTQPKGFWQLDSLTNNLWDRTSPTYNFGDITFTSAALCTTPWNPLTGVGCAGVTTSGKTYSGAHNLGSGKADFMAFAPTMDLSQFLSTDLFVVTINLGCNPLGVASGLKNPDGTSTTQGCNTNGSEEFGVIGGVGRQPPTPNPEPGSLALLGLGLAAAGLASRRRQRA